jgi:hypothetical protein
MQIEKFMKFTDYLLNFYYNLHVHFKFGKDGGWSDLVFGKFKKIKQFFVTIYSPSFFHLFAAYSDAGETNEFHVVFKEHLPSKSIYVFNF